MTLEKRFVKYFTNDSPSNFWMNIHFFTRKLEGRGFYHMFGSEKIFNNSIPKPFYGGFYNQLPRERIIYENEGLWLTPKGDIYISSLNKPKDYEGKRVVLLSNSEPKHIKEILEEMDIVRFKKND